MEDCGEVFRIVNIALLALVVGSMVTVARLHWKAWRRFPGQVGLTPLHVAMVASGVGVWGVALAWAMLDGLGNPVSTVTAARMSLYGLGALLILAALLIMATIQRRRVQFHREEVVVEVRSTDSVEITNPDLPARGERE